MHYVNNKSRYTKLNFVQRKKCYDRKSILKSESESGKPNEVIELTKSESEKQNTDIEKKMKKPRKKRLIMSPEESRKHKIVNNKKYYQKKKDVILNFEKHCPDCERVYKWHYWTQHVNSKRHIKNVSKNMPKPNTAMNTSEIFC